MRTIAIMGGTGFIGTHLVTRALGEGQRVRVVARDAERGQSLVKAGAEFASGDVTDPASLEDAFHGAEAVLNLTGIIVERGRNTFDAVHHRGAANVARAARAAGVWRLVHMSALGTRPDARSEYHRTKWLGEEAVRASGLDWTIHRPSVVYGPGDGFVSQLVRMAKLSPVLPVPGDGSNRLQPVWVGDVAACFLQSLERPRAVGRTYELGGPTPCTLEELMDLLLETLDKRRPKVHVPIPLLRAQAAILEKVLPSPPVTRDQLLMLQEENVCDTTAMRRDFDVEMPDLREGLRRMLRVPA